MRTDTGERFCSPTAAMHGWMRDVAFNIERMFSGKRGPDFVDYLDSNGFSRREIDRWADDGGAL